MPCILEICKAQGQGQESATSSSYLLVKNWKSLLNVKIDPELGVVMG